jgi:peptidoglycan/LPS O-acetylase OafA/YrhL
MRHYGFDWLRAAVIFLLFPFHTARVFDAWEPNYVKGAVDGFSTCFVASLGFWIMPLLFVIAGYSSYVALSKRTPKQYMKERFLRLMVPLLFGLILFVPPQGYMARLTGGFNEGYSQFLGEYFSNFSDLSGYTGYFTPAHLWFILYLFIISAVLLPLLMRMRRHPERLVWLSKPWTLLPCFILLTLMEALPDIGGKNIFYFGMLFLMGVVLATSPSFMDNLRRWRWSLLGGGVVASTAYILITAFFGWPVDWSPASIGFSFLRSLSVWLLTLGLLGVANAHLNKPSKALNYLSSASYPVYLVHQTVIVVIAYFVVRSNMDPAAQFIVIMSGALAASVACYALCRRFRPTRFILGIK